MRWIIHTLLWVLPLGALADNCEFSQQNDPAAYVHHVNQLDQIFLCFGQPNDQNPLSRQILGDLGQTDAPMRTTDEVVAVQQLALNWLREIEISLTSAGASSGPIWVPDFSSMEARLSEARLQVSNFDARVQAAPWSINNLRLFDGAVDLHGPIERSCQGGFTAECRTGLNAAAALVRHANLTHAVLNKVLSDRTLIPLYKQVSALDAKWAYYFEEGRSQYIWELAFNSWRFGKTADPGKLEPPPKGQWILLHPNAAVEYAQDGQNEDSEFNAVAVVEMLGYNRLSWREGSVLGGWPLGVSAIATISLGNAGDTLGWGAMIHVRNSLSFGAARRDAGSGTETTWLLSVDLAKMFMQVPDDTRKRFRFATE